MTHPRDILPNGDTRRVDPQPVQYRTAVALNAVADELRSATRKFPPMASAREGYAVILEELDEMWQEVKHGTTARAREEALQVAAMAIRFLIDIPDPDDTPEE